MKIVSFNDVNICTESFGSEHNPAILLIMGAASSMIWWENEFCERAKSEPPKDVDGLVEVAIQQWRITNQSKRPHEENHIRKMNRLDIERSNNFDCRMNHSYAQVTGDELGRIAEIAVPTLVIHGTEDVVIPYIHGEMLAKTISNAILLPMDGAGHELHPLDYDRVIEAICQRFC